jgi:hypothetical protein
MARTSLNPLCSSLRWILHHRVSPDPQRKHLTMSHQQRHASNGGSAQDPSGNIMAPWTFDVKFPSGTQFTFGSLTFATGEDGNIKMLPPGLAPEHLTSVYGQALYFAAISSTTGDVCSGLDPYVGLHIRTVKLVRGILIMASILQPTAGALSLSSSASSLDQDSTNDYPEIG